MELGWIENINSMISLVGVPGVVVVMWAIMPILILISMSTVFISVQKQSKKNEKALTIQLDALTAAITMLSCQIQSPPLNVDDSIDYFYLVMKSQLLERLRFLGGILKKNCIIERKAQIKKNIDSEFRKLTIEDCDKLSKKVTCAGDLGLIVREHSWDDFINEIYSIFFRVAPKGATLERKQDLDHLKIKDIELHISSTVDIMAKTIRERGVHN